MPTRRLLLCGLAAATMGAAPWSVRLAVERCAALPARDLAGLGADWKALAVYAEQCRVTGPDGRLGLLVDIIRIDRATDAGFFKTHTTNSVPLPTLRDSAGRTVGHLPEGFPVDPPGKLQVQFKHWRSGVPQEIALFEAGESALAPHALPSLHWQKQTHSYH